MLTLKRTVETTTELDNPEEIVRYLARDYSARRRVASIKAGAKVRITSRDGLPPGMAIGDVGVMVLPGEASCSVLVAHETAGVMVTAIRTTALEETA